MGAYEFSHCKFSPGIGCSPSVIDFIIASDAFSLHNPLLSASSPDTITATAALLRLVLPSLWLILNDSRVWVNSILIRLYVCCSNLSQATVVFRRLVILPFCVLFIVHIPCSKSKQYNWDKGFSSCWPEKPTEYLIYAEIVLCHTSPLSVCLSFCLSPPLNICTVWFFKIN